MSKHEDPNATGWLNLQKARAFVKKEYPYFYRTLLGMIPRHTPDVETMFVSESMVLGINMAWFATLPVDEAGGCLIHEVSHVLRDLTRIWALEDQELAGIASDMPLNDDLKKFGVKLPKLAIYSSTYGLPPGLSMEGYYNLLKNLPRRPSSGVCAGKCGSCNSGKDPVTFKDEPGRSAKEVQYFKKIGAQDLRDYIKAKGMAAGDIPGSWKEFLEFDKETPIVPWQSILGYKMSRAVGRIRNGHADFSMRRPARRSYFTGILRPGLIDYTPPVVVIEDTSISMGHDQLKPNRVELMNALRTLGIEDIWFISADVGANKPIRIRAQDLLTLPVVGRGGTNFCPAIAAAMRIHPRPELIFYSTDGGGRAPDTKPRNTEFVWLLAPGAWTVSPCNWGIQVLTTNDPDERKRYKLLT